MRLLPLLLLALACLFAGCESDAPAEGADPILEGRWEIETALRNRIPTTTLEDLYYEFDADGTLRTNLLGDDQVGSYTYDSATELITEGVKLPLTYELRGLTDTSLLLRARHQGFLFDFDLRRGEVLGEKESM